MTKSKTAIKKKKTTKSKKSFSWKKYLLAGISLIAGLGIVFGLMKIYDNSSNDNESVPVSYQVIQIAQDLVKQDKPAPTEAALYYAYIATVYNQTLNDSDQSSALKVSGEMLRTIFPEDGDMINQKISDIRISQKLDDRKLSLKAEIILKNHQQRFRKDRHDLVWDGVIPEGSGKWVKTSPSDPFTPMAGKWQRWNVDSSAINVVAPPKVGSQQDKFELQAVKQASLSRTGDQVNKINFWGGTPGTEGPAGIWQNQLYRTLHSDLPKDPLKADAIYASLQQNLAQTISDGFMECWKVKYTYWTARPNMRDKTIKTAMPNPPFPSYVSGHSTISKAAADVLSVMVPKYSDNWQQWRLKRAILVCTPVFTSLPITPRDSI